MIRTVLELAVAAALASAVVCAAFSQENVAAPATSTPAAKPVEDEIVVTGESLRNLRAELENAESAFYDQFNALNSSDEFDIHCRNEVPTGRRVPERVCQPNYVRDAQALAGKSQTMKQQNNASPGNAQEFQGIAHAKRQQLETEMQKLSRENAELQAALTRLVNAQQAYRASQKK